MNCGKVWPHRNNFWIKGTPRVLQRLLIFMIPVEGNVGSDKVMDLLVLRFSSFSSTNSFQLICLYVVCPAIMTACYIALGKGDAFPVEIIPEVSLLDKTWDGQSFKYEADTQNEPIVTTPNVLPANEESSDFYCINSQDPTSPSGRGIIKFYPPTCQNSCPLSINFHRAPILTWNTAGWLWKQKKEHRMCWVKLLPRVHERTFQILLSNQSTTIQKTISSLWVCLSVSTEKD